MTGNVPSAGLPVDLIALASRALDRPVVSARIEGRVEIAYDPYLAGRTVERVWGWAQTVDGIDTPWSAIVKRTSGVDLRAARRELAVYVAGLAAAAPGTGLRGPVLLAAEEGPSHVELWLEELRDEFGGAWRPERFGEAARHIAAWDAVASDHPLPADFDSEDAWAERHGQPHRIEEVLTQLDGYRRHPAVADVMALLDDPGFERLERLITTTPDRIEQLGHFRQTVLHHDLVRSNLFATAGGGTVAIDWENVGRGPFGVDLAPLVIGSVRRGEASVDDLPAIESRVLDGYEAGLRDAGRDLGGDARAAYRLALGLRWHVVLGTVGSWLDPASWGFRGSRRDEPRDEGLRHMIGVSGHILDSGADV